MGIAEIAVLGFPQGSQISKTGHWGLSKVRNQELGVKGLASNKLSPSGSAVAHGGNPQDRAASPPSVSLGRATP
ncbi:MAG: hypothetical protein MJK14_10070, partial [Rivularia sp. ALOHA_DT_140]|nr:hypothetical protein [Rivularia sp. ALOHA_DT_140]